MRADEPGPGGAYRILAVGGSTTECLFLNQDETWPYRLQTALTSPGRRVHVGNVGKSGHTTRQHVLQVEHLLRQHPDVRVVTLLAGVNDVQHVLAAEPVAHGPFDASDYAKAFTIYPDALAAPAGAPFYERTRLFRLVHPAPPGQALTRALVQDPEGRFYEQFRTIRRFAPKVDVLPDLSEALAEYRHNLEAIADLAARRSVRVVMITQPSLWRRDLPPDLDSLLWFGWVRGSRAYYGIAALAEAMDRFNAVLLDVCRERAECVDLAARLPRDTTVFYDDCHFNENGARLVAAAVAEQIRTTW
jgi:lysophospholipase L1-like esterase